MSKRPSSGSEGQATPPRNIVSWEEARLKQSLPRVIGRCMSYSAATCFDEALVAAVRRFYGIEVDVATAETDILEDDFERVRFFPWFLWDFVAQDGVTVGQRFLAEGELGELERSLVRSLIASSVTFVEVREVSPETHTLVFRDLLSREQVFVRDAGLASDLSAGQVSLVRLVRMPLLSAGGGYEGDPTIAFAMLDAIYAVLPAETRPMVELELEQLVGGLEIGEARRVMKDQAPELLDFAEHVLHELTEPPTLRNVDGEAIVLCRTFVKAADFAVTMVTPRAAADDATPGFSASEASGCPWVWREGGRTVGWIREQPGGWVVEASSRERFARMIEALRKQGARAPALHSEEELSRAVTQWLALGECEAWLTDPEVERAFRGHLGESLSQWPDRPHPLLGRRTPREVKGEPGGDAVVARLVQRVKKVAGEAASARLTSLLA